MTTPIKQTTCEFNLDMTLKLTSSGFRKLVFDYGKDQDWQYLGDLPAIIGFCTSWHGPFRSAGDALEELAKQYRGKLIVYKVYTEAESELSAIFDIENFPTFLFIPKDNTPLIQPGPLPKWALKQVIERVLLASSD